MVHLYQTASQIHQLYGMIYLNVTYLIAGSNRYACHWILTHRDHLIYHMMLVCVFWYFCCHSLHQERRTEGGVGQEVPKTKSQIISPEHIQMGRLKAEGKRSQILKNSNQSIRCYLHGTSSYQKPSLYQYMYEVKIEWRASMENKPIIQATRPAQ